MKPVIYNRGGFVAHVSVKFDVAESFDAFVEAANLAYGYGGQVERLYDDTTPSRCRVLGVERAGLVLEPGSLDDIDGVSAAVKYLRSERAKVKRGKYAAALDEALAVLDPDDSMTTSQSEGV